MSPLGPSGTIRSVTVLIRSATVFNRAGPGQSALICVAIVLVPGRTVLGPGWSVFICAWFCMNRVWSGPGWTVALLCPTGHAGSPRINTVPLRTFPEPTRSLHGPSRTSPDYPVLKNRPGLSRMTPAILSILKPPGWCPGPSRSMPDHAGPSRTVPDNPERWSDWRFKSMYLVFLTLKHNLFA